MWCRVDGDPESGDWEMVATRDIQVGTTWLVPARQEKRRGGP